MSLFSDTNQFPNFGTPARDGNDLTQSARRILDARAPDSKTMHAGIGTRDFGTPARAGNDLTQSARRIPDECTTLDWPELCERPPGVMWVPPFRSWAPPFRSYVGAPGRPVSGNMAADRGIWPYSPIWKHSKPVCQWLGHSFPKPVCQWLGHFRHVPKPISQLRHTSACR